MNFFNALSGSTLPDASASLANQVRPGGLASPTPEVPIAPDPALAASTAPPTPFAAPPPPDMGGGITTTPAAGMPEYKAITQSDGSIVIHIVSPGGILGPAVKIVPPIKQNTGGK